MIAAGRVLAPKKIRRFTGGVIPWLLCLAGLVVALVTGLSPHKDHLAKGTITTARVAAMKSVAGRKVYPLSVIGGGAYSAEELNRARRLDSVVKAHYANFGRNPVVQQTPADLFMYVSYRKSDAIYWTRTKRRIPKGESVLFDGENLARARCGNRLSLTPQQPTSPEKEPAEEAFNTPEAPKVSIPFDEPPAPATEADLYVPADPLPVGLLSPLPLSSPSPFTALKPLASLGAGGASLPAPGWGTGLLGGGAPFFSFSGGNGLALRTDAAPSASSPAVPAIVSTPGPATVSTPEPATARLLLLLSLLALAMSCAKEKNNPDHKD